MVWFLPLIVIGGLFFPVLGYIVVGMMAYFLTLAFTKGRYWCWHLCPRGAFLDLVMSKVSPKHPMPKWFSSVRLRWVVFYIFAAIVIVRLILTGGNWIAIGAVFVGTCVLTTAIAIVLATNGPQRSWCAICPMGTLQDKLGKLGAKKAPEDVKKNN